MRMEGYEWKADAQNQMIATGIQYLQLFIICASLMGKAICNGVRVPVPGFVEILDGSKIQFCLGTFFIGNMVQGNLLSTGAFEIFVNNELVYSKLATGEMPTMLELAVIF